MRQTIVQNEDFFLIFFHLRFYVPISSYDHVEAFSLHKQHVLPNHLNEEEGAVCFALIVLCLVYVKVIVLFLTVPWDGLQCVIVVYLDHTHLHFE